MIERSNISFKNTAEVKVPYTGYKREIYEGLSLGDVEFMHAEEYVVTIIDNNLTELTQRLNIPLPKIGLIKHWNENSPEDQALFNSREVLASSLVDETFASGIIRFSPYYLEEFVSYRLKLANMSQRSGRMPLPLTALCGHEAYHLWQFKHNREQMLSDLRVLDKKGLVSWSQTKSEVDATQFESNWLEQHYQGLTNKWQI